jgi:hypothetical protein
MHSFMTPPHLPTLELSIQIASNLSLTPFEFRPALIDWIMSAGGPAPLSVGVKQCLWRLLAWDYQGDPDATIIVDAPDLDVIRRPVLEIPKTPIHKVGDGARKNAYDISTPLSSEVSERLMQMVSRALVLAKHD